jgi:hypothetical protein
VTWENRIVLEASSADPDSDTPVWVDLSLRIRDNVQPVGLNTGRQNDLDTSEPSVLQALLDTADDALTYGNTTGPYPWWGPGRRIRYREVIGGVNVPLFDGFVSQLDETVTTRGIEQRVSVTAVDRLGRLGQARPFVSTLAEHILYSGGSSLVGYWTLGDAAGPFGPLVGTTVLTPIVENRALGGPLLPSSNVEGVGFGFAAGTTIPGDDMPTLLMEPTVDDTGIPLVALKIQAGAFAGITASGSDTIAMAMWVYDKANQYVKDHFDLQVMNLESTSADFLIFRSDFDGTSAAVAFDASAAAVAESDGLATWVDQFAWRLISIRYTPASGLLELYQGTRAAVTATMTPAGPLTLNDLLRIGQYWFGQLAHFQIYLGPDAFNRAAHLAQYAMGYAGLERQTTGERIRTIAQYAGIPASQLTQIDTGTSVMQRARLAGQTPLDAMRDAERTEQGLLYCDGNGNLVFKDRRTLYNI